MKESKSVVVIDKDRETKVHKQKYTNINLRIPTKMLEEVDLFVSDGYLTRTGWILAAIHRALMD